MGNFKNSRLLLKQQGLNQRMSLQSSLNQAISSQDDDYEQEGDLAVAESKPEVKQPSLYKVVLLNDDYTPMEFVVEILEVFFYMGREKATQIMLAVHTEGSAVCGIYPRDIAETKMTQVNEYAKTNQHPLLSQVEAAD